MRFGLRAPEHQGEQGDGARATDRALAQATIHGPKRLSTRPQVSGINRETRSTMLEFLLVGPGRAGGRAAPP
jgi:hypothetical protein